MRTGARSTRHSNGSNGLTRSATLVPRIQPVTCSCARCTATRAGSRSCAGWAWLERHVPRLFLTRSRIDRKYLHRGRLAPEWNRTERLDRDALAQRRARGLVDQNDALRDLGVRL